MELCNGKTRKAIELQLSNCLNVIHKYEWLHSSLLHDFFVNNHWDSLPKGWSDQINKLSPNGLAKFLSYWDTNNSENSSYDGVILPLELLALRSCITQYALSRKPAEGVQEALELLRPISCNEVSRSEGK